MKVSNRTDREARRRAARMEARQALARNQGRRRLKDNVYAGIAGALVLALAVALQVFWFSSNPTAEDLALLESQAKAGSSETGSASAIPDPSLAEGRIFSGALSLNGAPVGIELDGNVAPQAVAVFKSLSDEGFFDGKSCHRLTTGESMGVLQCGSADGTGASDPDYQSIAATIAALEEAWYDGWYVLEQDVALTDGEPPLGEGPVLAVQNSMEYLRSLAA